MKMMEYEENESTDERTNGKDEGATEWRKEGMRGGYCNSSKIRFIVS